MEDFAFQYCPNLTSITLPEGLTAIGTYNFYLMKNLKTIVLPTTLETIGRYSFTSLMSLESVNLEDTKVSSYDYNFVGIGSQKEFIIPDAGKAATIVNSFNYMVSHETLTVRTAVAKVQNSFMYGPSMKTATFEKNVDVMDNPSGVSFRICLALETLNCSIGSLSDFCADGFNLSYSSIHNTPVSASTVAPASIVQVPVNSSFTVDTVKPA